MAKIEAAARYAPWMALPVLLGGAAVIWLRYGPPAVILWFCFALLAGAILLFWEAMRTAIDPTAPGDEGTLDAAGAAGAAGMTDAEDRKRAALRALKDIEFEHSIQRLSDDDYATLRERYRAEARAAMEAIDHGLGTYLSRADELIARVESGVAPDALAAEPALEETDKGPRRNRKKKKGPASATESVGVGESVSEARDVKDATESVGAGEIDTRRACASCATRNDDDATFCKKCGTRL